MDAFVTKLCPKCDNMMLPPIKGYKKIDMEYLVCANSDCRFEVSRKKPSLQDEDTLNINQLRHEVHVYQDNTSKGYNKLMLWLELKKIEMLKMISDQLAKIK